mgnify:FL=1
MVSRTNKIIKMKKHELSNIEEVDKVIEEIEKQMLWELGSKAEPKQEDEEEVQYTCCGDEITGEVEDIGLCPTCLEYI